jgi:hypothetical protein
MFELLKQHNVPGALGFLLGIALVAWIQPTTTAGVGLLILVSMLICIVLASVLRNFLPK